MGNKPAKQETKKNDVILVRAMPQLDRAYIKWLTRDIESLYCFAPKNPRAIKPPEIVIEYLSLFGWLDLDMDDPDLAPLFSQ